MTIKYGELTIIKNDEQTILSSLLYWITSKKSEYIFLFDDGTICDYDDKIHVDLDFEFLNRVYSVLPAYFEKKINDNNQRLRVYFDKKINTESSDSLLHFNQLFSSYLKYKSEMNILSKYNCIYYCHKSLKTEIFGLLRIKSSEQMPRYQFAYDSDEFTKEEIIYLIHYIFNS
jgi:hypothetical protein